MAPGTWMKETTAAAGMATGVGAAPGFVSTACYQSEYAMSTLTGNATIQSSVDAYKSMLGTAGEAVTASLGGEKGVRARRDNLGPLRTSTSTVRSSKSSRYTNCTCPNCTEAERLGITGDNLRKFANVHSCHIDGCGKVSSRETRDNGLHSLQFYQSVWV